MVAALDHHPVHLGGEPLPSQALCSTGTTGRAPVEEQGGGSAPVACRGEAARVPSGKTRSTVGPLLGGGPEVGGAPTATPTEAPGDAGPPESEVPPPSPQGRPGRAHLHVEDPVECVLDTSSWAGRGSAGTALRYHHAPTAEPGRGA